MNKRLALTAGLLCLAGSAAAQETLLWSDEFDSGTQPDEKFWSYDIGRGIQGWGNQELQYYTDDPVNVSIVDGALRIRAQPDNTRVFTSARIKTEDKLTILYGTIEARIKVPNLADGLWPAFWTLGNNFKDVGWPFCGELDIMEMGNSSAIADGVVNRRVGSTAHWQADGFKADFGASIDAPQDLNDDWHIFRMEWTPNNVSTYLDGELIWVIDIRLRPSSCPTCTEFHEPHFLLLNMAVGGTYTGIRSSGGVTAPMPADMLIDWVRVYDNGFTVLGGTGAEDLGPPDIGPSHSGSWYNDSQNGHGFAIEVGEVAGTPVTVAYWYIYDSVGNPIFFSGSGVPDGNTVDINFVSPVGMRFGEFNPLVNEEMESGGVGRFVFEDDGTGTFSYEPSAFSINTWGHEAIEDLPITKIFGIPTAGDSPSGEE